MRDQTFEMLLKQKLATQHIVVTEQQIERLARRFKTIHFDIQKYKKDGAGLSELTPNEPATAWA
jgi:hypothetical protein